MGSFTLQEKKWIDCSPRMGSKVKTFTVKTAWNKFGQAIQDTLKMDRGLLEEDFEQYKSMQPDASIKDYMWSLFNRILLETAGDYTTQSGIYYSMAIFLAEYESNNGNQYARLALAQEVNKAQMETAESSQSVIWELEVIADTDCEHAKSLDGKKFPITDDLVLPLANEDCTRELCRCTVSRVAKRDEDGRIIFKKRPQVQQPQVQPSKEKKRFWEFWK